MTSYIYIISIILSFVFLPVFAAENVELPYKIQKVPLQGKNFIQSKTIKGTVSESKELPKEFYGAWSVSTKLIKADNPSANLRKTLEIWKLEKYDNKVTLSNPITGASASVIIDDVKNNTATFNRTRISKNLRDYEKVTITVNDDYFYGSDVQVSKFYNDGNLIKTEVSEYQLKGIRINNPLFEEIFSE